MGKEAELRTDVDTPPLPEIVSPPPAPAPPAPEPPSPSRSPSPPPAPAASQLVNTIEKFGVYFICLLVLCFVGASLHRSIGRADTLYKSVVDDLHSEASNDGIEPRDRMTTTVAVLGMRDMSTFRSGVLFAGFVIVLMGCVLVLKGVEASYNLKLARGTGEATLGTSSPGLVLITGGVLLVVFAMRQESSVSLDLQSHGQIDVRTVGQPPDPNSVRANGDGIDVTQ